MKRSLVPLLVVALVSAMILGGCATPAPAPAPAPAPTPAPADPLIPWGSDFATKPDGTPYSVAYTICWLGDEWTQSAAGVGASLIDRAGGETKVFDPNLDVQVQVGFLEDTLSLYKPDALILHPVEEGALTPIAEMYEDANIPVFNFDLMIPSQKVTCEVAHDLVGVGVGDDLLGEYLAQQAKALGKPLKVYYIWGQRAMQQCHDKETGFKRATDKYPDLLTVVDSPDSEWSPEIMADLVQDAFTADPELNATCIQGGMTEGVTSALRLIGRLYPVGDPQHVIVVDHDLNPSAIRDMEAGYVDATLSDTSQDLIQAVVNFLFYDLVLGESVPKRTDISLVLVTTDNMDTLQTFGVDVVYTHYPWQEWDEWPVMDFSEWGYPTPTKEMRMNEKGY